MNQVTIDDPKEVAEMVGREYPKNMGIDARFDQFGWKITVRLPRTDTHPMGKGESVESAFAMLEAAMDRCDPIKNLKRQADGYGYRIVKKKEPVEV